VLASDIDARSTRVARENVRRNRAHGVTVVHAAGLGARTFKDHGPFDLVLANILLAPLQRLARPMAAVLAPDARVVLSGLLTTQASAALSAYRRHALALERQIALDGWSTLILRAAPTRISARKRRPSV
jgi:ribosomal protein L11 methyltransferase